MAPVAGLERHGPAAGRDGVRRLVGAREQQREGGVSFGQIGIEVGGRARVRDRGDQRVAVGRVARTRRLKAPEVRVREPDVRQRVLRIERERTLEVRDRGRHLRRVERLELEPALGERAVGVEARRLARADASRAAAVTRSAVRTTARSRAVLQVKHVGQRTVGLRLRERAARGDLDHARGDAQLIAGALKAADDHQIEAARACGVGVRPAAWPRGSSVRSITRSSRIARRSFVTVSAMPADSHATSASPVTFAKSRTAIDRVPARPPRSG